MRVTKAAARADPEDRADAAEAVRAAAARHTAISDRPEPGTSVPMLQEVQAPSPTRASPTPASAMISGKTEIVRQHVRVSIAMIARSVMIVARARILGARSEGRSFKPGGDRAEGRSFKPREDRGAGSRSEGRSFKSREDRGEGRAPFKPRGDRGAGAGRFQDKKFGDKRPYTPRGEGGDARPAYRGGTGPRTAQGFQPRRRSRWRQAVAEARTVTRRRQPPARARWRKTFRQTPLRQAARGSQFQRASAFLASA